MDLRKKYIRKLKSGRVLFIMMLVCAAFVSCIKDDFVKSGSSDMKAFLKKKEYGLVGYDRYQFKYSDNDCQLCVNKRGRYMRMQNDTQSSYVHVVFAANPTVADKNVQVEIRYRWEGDENVRSVTMVNVKASDDKIWLWNEENRTGLIIPVL